MTRVVPTGTPLPSYGNRAKTNIHLKVVLPASSERTVDDLFSVVRLVKHGRRKNNPIMSVTIQNINVDPDLRTDTGKLPMCDKQTSKQTKRFFWRHNEKKFSSF